MAQEKTPPELVPKISFEQIDISYPLPFNDNAYDVVYSHLALHYFDEKTTHQIFDEIYRVLRTGGIFALIVNSINDQEYGTGREIEKDYFEIGGMKKRYFNIESLRPFVNKFEKIVLDNQGTLIRNQDQEKRSRENLIRFVGRKV